MDKILYRDMENQKLWIIVVTEYWGAGFEGYPDDYNVTRYNVCTGTSKSDALISFIRERFISHENGRWLPPGHENLVIPERDRNDEESYIDILTDFTKSLRDTEWLKYYWYDSEGNNEEPEWCNKGVPGILIDDIYTLEEHLNISDIYEIRISKKNM